MSEPERCTRNCGRVATCVVTRIRDGRARPYCTECTVEAIALFGNDVKVDTLPCPERSQGLSHEWVTDPVLGDECLWCMAQPATP